MSDETRPLLGITMGDPAGVGPEITVKALQHAEVFARCRPLVIGDLAIIQRAAALLQATVEVAAVAEPAAGQYQPGRIDVLQAASAAPVAFGQLSAAGGRLGVEAVVRAVQLAQARQIDAIVTAPLNKEAMALAGYTFPGHTEILAEMTGARAAMLLVTGKLRVVHVSTHVALREAIELISAERVLATIRLAAGAAAQLGFSAPRVAVAGLNPHAGEAGRFGREEIESIAPAIEQARAAGIDARGPVPPDTLFFRASQGEFDMVVAMYHDQGHIPVKLLGFDEGVNVTIGLPIIRTSVDHGTAYDIAGTGRAREASMLQAIEVALQLVAARR
jgi:4-hydroxythreonine-4-phosphate dehydrogenase